MVELTSSKEMLYQLKLNNLPFFTNSENFKKFIRLSLLEKGTLNGFFSFERSNDWGIGYLVNRKYNASIDDLRRPIFVEKDMNYDYKPNEQEVFKDMTDNLKSYCNGEFFVSVDNFGNFEIRNS